MSFGGPIAEKKSNLCDAFGMTNEEEAVEEALMASSSAAVTSEGSISSDLATFMVDSGASGHYFDDAIIRDLKHCLQDYVHLATPRKILPAGEAMLDGTVEGLLQGLVTDDYGNQILVRVIIVVVAGIGCNLFSVMTAAKKGIMIIFDYENPRLEGFNITVPLRSESGDLYSFLLDSDTDRYDAKELAINAVANVQVYHRRQSFPLAVVSFVVTPKTAANTPGRNFGSIAWRPVLSKSSPLSTRRSKSMCPNVWGELCAP